MAIEMARVEKPAPYSYLPLPMSPIELKLLSSMDPGYTAWNATRELNPFIQREEATGFEGYFVGMKKTPQEVADAIATLGVHAMRAIRRLHQNEPSYLQRLKKVAEAKVRDLDMLAELNLYLVANIGRLRLQVHPLKNKPGDQFRTRIADLVKGKLITYSGTNGVVAKHEIIVPKILSSELPTVLAVDAPVAAIANPDTFLSTDELREGYEFMKAIGKSGYPLARLAISKRG